MLSLVRSLWEVFLHAFARRVTIQYPDEKPYLAPRYRGRIVLSRDPDGGERCVACNLCAVACPVDCIYPDPVWSPGPAEWWTLPLCKLDPYK